MDINYTLELLKVLVEVIIVILKMKGITLGKKIFLPFLKRWADNIDMINDRFLSYFYN